MSEPHEGLLTRVIDQRTRSGRLAAVNVVERPPLTRMRDSLRDVFVGILGGLLRHRAAISMCLFVGTWLIGGFGLYTIGHIFGGEREFTDAAGQHPYNWSLINCLFMAAITMSTVGYGDYVDVNSLSPEGRTTAMTFLILFNLSSYLVLLYVSGSILSFLVEGTLAKYFKRRRMEKELHEVRGHYIVCGGGSTGSHIVNELAKVGKAVVVIDASEEHLQHVLKEHPEVLHLKGDALDDDTLREVGIDRAAGIFAALPEDKDNILLTVTARQASGAIRVVARASQAENISKLKRVGADAVISPNQIGGLRMASEMVRPHVVSFLDAMLRDSTAVTRFEQVVVNKGGNGEGKSLEQLGVLHKLGLAVIAVARGGTRIEYNPSAQTTLNAGDSVIVVTDRERLTQLEKLLN